MEQEDAEHAIAIDARETERLPLGKKYQSQYECKEQKQHACRPEKAFLLAYCAEYKVGILFRHIFQLGLRSVKKALAFKSA